MLRRFVDSFDCTLFALSDRTTDTLVLDFFKLQIYREPDTSIVVPHVAKITAEHQRSVLWLSADAEQLLLRILDLEIVQMENFLHLLDWPDFKDGLGKRLPI